MFNVIIYYLFIFVSTNYVYALGHIFSHVLSYAVLRSPLNVMLILPSRAFSNPSDFKYFTASP